MAEWSMAYHVIARHGYAIERLKRDMADEPSREHLVEFLAYDVANFVWAFLLATGNLDDRRDKAVRDALRDAIIAVLAAHGIDRQTLVVRPDIDADAPL
jgi:hypothetical protein